MKSILTGKIVFTCLIVLGTACEPQNHATEEKLNHDIPKLVVGIMVDQMRPDYIYRYWEKYGEDGFKRLVNEGFTFRNTHFDYMPTATGPGHTGVAYWYEGVTGNFVSSTYYSDALPEWLQEFNDRNLPQQYLNEPWGNSSFDR